MSVLVAGDSAGVNMAGAGCLLRSAPTLPSRMTIEDPVKMRGYEYQAHISHSDMDLNCLLTITPMVETRKPYQIPLKSFTFCSEYISTMYLYLTVPSHLISFQI